MSFSSLVPADNLTPFVFVEFDESGAMGDAGNILSFKNLIIGQSLETGSIAAGKLVKAQSPDLVAKYFGKGSQLHHMSDSHCANDVSTEKYYISIKADNTKPEGKLKASITVAGEALSDGVLNIYIGDRKYQISVAETAKPSEICSLLAKAINLDELRYVDTVVHDGKAPKIDLVARQSGQSYKSVKIHTNYYSDDSSVKGVDLKIVQFAGNVANPAITPEHIEELGSSTQYNIIATALTDSSNLKILIEELEDRWGPSRQVDGHLFGCTHLSKEEFQNKKNSQFHTNSKQYSIFYNKYSASPSFKWAAAIAGVCSREMQVDPNRQLNEVKIKGLWSPKSEYSMNQRNDILRNGVSTWKLDASGNPLLERVVSQYLYTPSGDKNIAYRDLTIKMTLSYLRYDWRVHIKTKYPRHKLADDGTRFRTGKPIITPNVIKAELLTKYRVWEFDGYVEGYSLFKEGLIVQRNSKDRDRIDCKIKPDIVNQLRTQSYLFSFLI